MEEEMQWYLGFVCKDIGDDNYLVEHLERHPPSQNDFWRHQKLKICKQFLKGKSCHAELMEFGEYLHRQPHVLIQNIILKTHNRLKTNLLK